MAGSALAKPLMLTQVLWLKTESNQVIIKLRDTMAGTYRMPEPIPC